MQCSIFQTGQLTVEECSKCKNITNVKELRGKLLDLFILYDDHFNATILFLLVMALHMKSFLSCTHISCNNCFTGWISVANLLNLINLIRGVGHVFCSVKPSKASWVECIDWEQNIFIVIFRCYSSVLNQPAPYLHNHLLYLLCVC